MKLQHAQAKFDQFAIEQGVPPIPLVLNEKGQPDAPGWWIEHQKASNQAKTEAAKARAEQNALKERMYQDAIKDDRELEAGFKDVNPHKRAEEPELWAQHEWQKQQRKQGILERERAARQRYFPEEFGDVPDAPAQRPPSRANLAEARNIAQANGLPQDRVVSSQDDLDRFQAEANRSGENFQVVDSSTGQLAWINPR
jgi:hypothetical protein